MKQRHSKKGGGLLTVDFANDGLIIPQDLGFGSNRPNIIYAANEDRFTSSTFREDLTEYLVGWRTPGKLEDIIEAIAPEVPAPRRFGWKKMANAEQFLSEDDDVRAIGASFKRVEYKGSSVDDSTLNKGLTIRIDKDEQFGDDWQERAAGRLWERLLRNEIRRALALLNAAATNANVTWDPTANPIVANPDGDMRTALRAGKNDSGLRPTRVLIADDAWEARLDVYEAKNTPASGRAADLTPEGLARKLRVERVQIMEDIYQSTASAKALLQTSLTILYYHAMSGLGKDDPSNIKRFVTPTESGPRRVYVQEHEKFTDITVEHYSKAVVTATEGVRKNTVALS